MNRNAVAWIVAGIGVFGVAILALVFGANLVPARAVAQAKGTIAPWYLVWGMTLLTAAMGVFLAGFLVKTGLSVSRSQ
jgi:hypothetical protein